PATATGRTGDRHARAEAFAGGTRLTIPRFRAPYRSEPSTVRAGSRLDARGRAGGATGLARRQPVDRHVRFDPGDRLRERQLDRNVGIATAATKTGGARRLGVGPPFGPAALPVVQRAGGGIAQDAIGFRDLLKQRPRVTLPEVDVGRIPAREALVRAANLHRRGSRIHLEHRVVVTHGRARGPTLLRGPRAPPLLLLAQILELGVDHVPLGRGGASRGSRFRRPAGSGLGL